MTNILPVTHNEMFFIAQKQKQNERFFIYKCDTIVCYKSDIKN